MSLLVFLISLFQILSLFFTQDIFAQESPQIIISEVYPQPVSGENEWVEITNVGTNSVNLAGWILEDSLSTPKKIYQFEQVSLEPLEVFVATVSSALNNGSDGVTLRNNLQEIIFEMDYQSSSLGMSWSYNPHDNTYIESPITPGFFDMNLGGVETSPSPSIIASPFASPSPSPEQNIKGKIELVSLLSCPENGQEWLELKNISGEYIDNTIYLSDNQDNVLSFDVALEAGEIHKYSLDRHIINNSGDKISFYGSNQNEDLFSQYFVPECKHKGITFINVEGQLVEIKSNLETKDDDTVYTLDKKDHEDVEEEIVFESTNSEQGFVLGTDYLNRLHFLEGDDVLNKEQNKASGGAKFIEGRNYEDEVKRGLLIAGLCILIGTSVSIVCIMYIYGKTPQEDSALD